MGDHMTQGTWTPWASWMHINIWAGWRACQAYLPTIHSRHVLIISDNTSAIYYINKQGGTKSTALSMEVVNLWDWRVAHKILLSAAYLPRTQNMIADSLSRRFVANHKWELHNTVVSNIFNQWGTPTKDFFFASCVTPSSSGAICAPFVVIGPHSQGSALVLHWLDQINYASLPLLLLPHVLHEIKRERATVILIAPFCPRQFWFTSLLCMSAHPLPILTFPELLMQHSGKIRRSDPHMLYLRARYLDGHFL